MHHYMTLMSGPFAKVSGGYKDIEIRCYDEKRRKIQVGDTITFTRVPDHFNEAIMVEVTGIYPFKSFRELFAAFPPQRFGYLPTDSPEVMLKGIHMIYPPEREKREGVVGIEIKLL